MKQVTKKFCVAMMLGCALLVAGCTEESQVLDKTQGSAEKMVKILDSSRPTKYVEVVKVFTKGTAEKFTKDAYEETIRICGEKFGKMQSYKFVSFHRFDNEDLVVYFANFDKEKIVSMQFLFDKQGKMMNFKFQPVQAQEQKKE